MKRYLLLVLLALAACQASGPAGHLVIAGGGLSSGNALVYGTILELAGPEATVGVLPTASGEWERSGARARDTFDQHAGAPVTEVIAITRDDPGAALLPEVADRLRGHEVLWFTGGSQSRIVGAFRPDGLDSPAYDAVRDVLDAGGVVAGSSAGAAMMSDPMIYRGSSADALGHGVGPDGVEVGPGMGLFPFGLTGQHFLARGRTGRMIVALEATGVARGYGIEEDSAIHVDLATAEITTLGPRALALIDLSGMERRGQERRGMRLSILGSGEGVDGRTGELRPAARLRPLGSPESGGLVLPEAHDAWGRGALGALVERLAVTRATEIRAAAGDLVLVLSEDERTRFFVAPDGDPATITAHHLRMDLLGAEAAASQLVNPVGAER